MNGVCAGCSAEIDHCHGTLILHTRSVVECTDAGCDELSAVRHRLILDCGTIDGGCECARASRPELLQRAS